VALCFALTGAGCVRQRQSASVQPTSLSAARSTSGVSCSWPTAETTGTGQSATARTSEGTYEITGSVLSLSEAAPARPLAPVEDGSVVYMTQPLDRPGALPGQTYKVRWPDSDHAIYITLNDIIQDGRRRPFEIFINSKNMEHFAWTVALTRMISAVFRRGGDVSFVVEELKAVFDPRGGQWIKGHYVPSLLAAIGEVIEAHLIDIGFIAGPGSAALKASRGRGCPKCGAPSLVRLEGCDSCTNCDYSRCG